MVKLEALLGLGSKRLAVSRVSTARLERAMNQEFNGDGKNSPEELRAERSNGSTYEGPALGSRVSTVSRAKHLHADR
ncbi:hypothetical protein CBOM_02585 [Ceraceosorus bombacis]|uniref:Uncharacterized protein n=1 Tax=Ceraceosorus bombacis TaxID=401625 RepID=A0A0P1BFR0_9BASI|nr:hypothetical protein CBOM_02585 [Ceraceosorus bombacis]